MTEAPAVAVAFKAFRRSPSTISIGCVPGGTLSVDIDQDKVGALAFGGGALGPAAAAQVIPVGAGADAVSALLNLGFRPAEAASAVGAAEEDLGPGATLDALVRLALRKAAK